MPSRVLAQYITLLLQNSLVIRIYSRFLLIFFLNKRDERSYKTFLFNFEKLFEVLRFFYYGFTLNLSAVLFAFFSMPHSCCAPDCLCWSLLAARSSSAGEEAPLALWQQLGCCSRRAQPTLQQHSAWAAGRRHHGLSLLQHWEVLLQVKAQQKPPQFP